VSSRIVFGAELGYAMHVRGLSLTEVARQSGVAIATASAAVAGRPVNVTTALRIARAVAASPIIPELLGWVERPVTSGLHPLDSSSAESPDLRREVNSQVSAPNRRRRVARTPRQGVYEQGQLRIAPD
jgi:transcriptional regulator with XRE-family HTH domain